MCVCFADLWLRCEGWGLRLRAVPAGEILQREVRDLQTAQRLRRPLQSHRSRRGNSGQRRRVRTLFTGVSSANTTTQNPFNPMKLKTKIQEAFTTFLFIISFHWVCDLIWKKKKKKENTTKTLPSKECSPDRFDQGCPNFPSEGLNWISTVGHGPKLSAFCVVL